MHQPEGLQASVVAEARYRRSDDVSKGDSVVADRQVGRYLPRSAGQWVSLFVLQGRGEEEQ